MVKKASLHPSLKSSSSFKPFDKGDIVEIACKTSSKDLSNPTLQKFGEFMSSADFSHVIHAQNVNEYAGTAVHPNIQKDLCTVAAKNGIKCGLVTVKYKNSSAKGIFNAIKVKGEGIIFLDVETEGAYDLDTFTGNVQRTQRGSLFTFPKKPHYVTRTGSKRTISSITIKW